VVQWLSESKKKRERRVMGRGDMRKEVRICNEVENRGK
jgi:hypothetical protein